MNRKTFVDALSALFPSVSSKPILEDMGCFRIADKVLRTADGITQTEVTLPEATGLNISVRANKFFHLLKAMTDDTITMEVEGNDLTVRGGKSIAKYVVSTEADFLDSLDFTVDSWNPVLEGFVEALNLCLASASREASRGVLTGVLVSPKWLVGSDGYRIARYATDLPLEAPVVLSEDLIKRLGRSSADVTDWAVKGDMVFFKIGKNTVVGGKSLAGDYPNVGPFFAEAGELAGNATLPESLSSTLRRHIDQLSELPSMSQDIVVALDGSELVTSSTDKATFSLTEEAVLEHPVDTKISFRVRPTVLLAILDKTRAMRYGEGVEIVLFAADLLFGKFEYLACVEAAK